MDKLTLAFLTLATAAGAIAISLAVTVPFIRRYRDLGAPIVSMRITNWIAPYFDIFEAFQIAQTKPGARLPFATIVQAMLLAALPILVVLYLSSPQH